jgi:hypothetical protein
MLKKADLENQLATVHSNILEQAIMQIQLKQQIVEQR